MLATRKGTEMLVLTRKSNQSIMIGDDIEVSVLSVMGEKVRIGIQAPQRIPVFRKEIYLEIHREDDAVPADDDGHLPEAHESLEKLGDS
jgi:carbon storage regulator